jgi:hypothetical protein
MNRFAQFEARVERLVEGTFSRLFSERVRPLEVAGWINRAVEDNQVVSADGVPQAPTHYWIYLRPEDHDALTADQPTLEADLAAHVAQLAAHAGLALTGTPSVFVLPRPGLGVREVLVETKWIPTETPVVERTHKMRAEDLRTQGPQTGAPPGRPFLILDGRRSVDLDQSVVTVGRGLDNDIILEDPRVSRRHAQLRLRYDHYVLHDLGSHAGTKINGYRVEECVLHSGDVISFGGLQVVYGEDRSTPGRLQDTQNTPSIPLPPAPDG